MFLDGITVLEVGDGIGGAWAGAVFRDLGATVLRRPRRLAADSAFETWLNRDKQVVDAAVDADIVLWDRVERLALDEPAGVDAYLATVDRCNLRVWVTISAYGLSGPNAERFGSDFTVSAEAGIVAYARDGDGRPCALPGRQALLGAGQAAVLAGLHGLDAYRRTDVPVHMDVSAQEAMIATGPTLQCTETTLNYQVTGGTHRFGAPAGWFACADGPIYVALHEDHQWEAVKRAIDPPVEIAALHTAHERIQHAEAIDRYMVEWARRRSKSDAEARLQGEGAPATALYSLAELRDSPRFAHRGRWLHSAGVTAMGSPYVIEEGDETAHSGGLSGLRVVEASHILAASLAGSVLGAMGAHVIKIEEAARLDQYRRSGPFIDGRTDPEWSGYFSTANHSKHSFRFTDTAQVDDLVAEADVVLENWGRSRAGRLGIDAASVHRRFRGKLGVSCSGFGHTGPLAGYRVYAANLNAFCGLLASLGDTTGQKASPGVSWVDYTTAYALATVAAAWAIGGRVGASVDVSMAEVIVQRFTEVLLLADAPIADVALNGARSNLIAPSGNVFDVADGQVAVDIGGLGDWSRLRDAAGLGAAEPDDEHRLRAAIQDMNGAVLTARLEELGLSAGRILDAGALTRDVHLHNRGFFVPVDHPQWGRRRLVGLPWRFVGAGPLPLAAPPLLDTTDHAQPWPPREENAACPTSSTSAPAGSAG